jgi:hypothetical protein
VVVAQTTVVTLMAFMRDLHRSSSKLLLPWLRK